LKFIDKIKIFGHLFINQFNGHRQTHSLCFHLFLNRINFALFNEIYAKYQILIFITIQQLKIK